MSWRSRRRAVARAEPVVAPLVVAAAVVVGSIVSLPLLGSAKPAAGAVVAEAHARFGGVRSQCHPDGLTWAGELDLDLPAGGTVTQHYRVFRGEVSRSLGSVATPVAVAVRATVRVDEPQYFGPAWTDGLPFTFEQRTVVELDGAAVRTQTVTATCTAAAAAPAIEITEAGPGDPEPPAVPDSTVPPGPATPPVDAPAELQPALPAGPVPARYVG